MAEHAPRMLGAFSEEKTDAETLALFAEPAVLAAVNAALGTAYAALTGIAYKSQVVRRRCALRARAHLLLPRRSLYSLPPPARRAQVAGLKYRVKAEADGNKVTISAFKGLPHTGGALEVQAVEAGHESF